MKTNYFSEPQCLSSAIVVHYWVVSTFRKAFNVLVIVSTNGDLSCLPDSQQKSHYLLAPITIKVFLTTAGTAIDFAFAKVLLG